MVGQAAGVFLLDLSTPSGRESMPVLASLQLPARVAALADYPDGDEVLIRLIDGRMGSRHRNNSRLPSLASHSGQSTRPATSQRANCCSTGDYAPGVLKYPARLVVILTALQAFRQAKKDRAIRS